MLEFLYLRPLHGRSGRGRRGKRRLGSILWVWTSLLTWNFEWFSMVGLQYSRHGNVGRLTSDRRVVVFSWLPKPLIYIFADPSIAIRYLRWLKAFKKDTLGQQIGEHLQNRNNMFKIHCAESLLCCCVLDGTTYLKLNRLLPGKTVNCHTTQMVLIKKVAVIGAEF